MNNNYRIALAEVYEILKYTDDDIVNQIPKKFIKFILDNMDYNHKFQVQKDLDLFEQPIRNETKTILAMIYKDYFCTDAERQELIDFDKMQIDLEEKIKYEKYNPNNIFNNRNNNPSISENISSEKNAMIEYKEKNFIQKLFGKIRNIFKREKKY